MDTLAASPALPPPLLDEALIAGVQSALGGTLPPPGDPGYDGDVLFPVLA
jgi:hypothetical protein